MNLTIVYDNTVYKKNLGLKDDWGFSCLVETEKDTILFDTGAKGEILLKNMKKLGINPEGISKIVISHEHWDHNGGLESIYSFLQKDAEIYRFEKNQTKDTKLFCVNEPVKIAKNVYSTGRLTGDPIDEQSLILKGKKGWYVLAGCSHSGVKSIIEKAEKHGKIKGIIGGLHGFSDFYILKDLDLICPLHCTKHKEKIYDEFYDKVIKGGVGKNIEL